MDNSLSSLNIWGFRVAGLLILLAGWQWAAVAWSGLVVAPPAQTLAAALQLIGDGEFLTAHFLVTLKRMAMALGIAVTAGVAIGVATGLVPAMRSLIEPLRWMLMTVPGVVIVVVFMLWFGMGTRMVVAIAAAMAAPVIFVHVADGMAVVDKSLLEMAKVYRFSLGARLVQIYAMAAAGPFFSALVVAAGQTVRVTVLAEVLGAGDGLGYCLAIARTRLDTAGLYALALISMSVVGGLELFLLRPLEKQLKRRCP